MVSVQRKSRNNAKAEWVRRASWLWGGYQVVGLKWWSEDQADCLPELSKVLHLSKPHILFCKTRGVTYLPGGGIKRVQ